jgi:hypothetical protein
VFHRVIVNVINVALEIELVLDGMLPKPALPDCALSPPLTRIRSWALDAPQSQISLCELLLDPTPAYRMLSIAMGERPEGVEVVWQENDGRDVERVPLLDNLNRLT